MQVEIANVKFCQSARYAHGELNRALYRDMTLGRYLAEEHLPNHNFRPEFTHKEITLGKGVPRYHHDVCHALLAMAYKKMGVDTTQFKYWYNGNEYAEAMVIPMENFFTKLLNPRSSNFSEDSYFNLVDAYFDDKKIYKERLRQETVVMIADNSLTPKTAFEICRKCHFEMDYLGIELSSMSLNDDEADSIWERSKILNTIVLPVEIDGDHIRNTYQTLKPVFTFLEKLLEPQILTPYPKSEFPRMHETLKSIKMRNLWEVISGEPYIRPKIKPTPSPL